MHTSAMARMARWIFLLMLGGSGVMISAQSGSPAVRLEPHEGITQFLIGDLIRLDLVFSKAKPGYSVETNPYTYLPLPDVIDVNPAGGWSRSHNAVAEVERDLVPADTVATRVPVLINRAITFTRPGTYAITITTNRLVSPGRLNAAPEDALTTNAVEIDVRLRSEAEESGLVRELSAELAKGPRRPDPPHIEHPESLSVEQMAKLINDMVERTDQATAERRENAWKLAFLPGDDAMRARVALIVASPEDGSGDPIEPILVQGLPSSRNVELQAQLLDAAWRDPGHVPTDILETAVRQSRELMHGQTVADTQISYRYLGDPVLRAKTDKEQAAIRSELQVGLQELVETLSQRDAANREKTVCFLKLRGMAQDGSPVTPERCKQN